MSKALRILTLEQVAGAVIWTLAALAAATLLIALTVGLWRFGSVAADDGWLAALQSLDLRGVGLAAGGIATMVGVAIAALMGYYKFQLFREGRPHLTIDLTASHRPVSPRHIHLGVTARLSNTSKVKIDVRRCVWELYVVAPYDAADLQTRTSAWHRHGGRDWDEFPWDWIQDEVTAPQEKTIEPGEIEETTFDFVVDSRIKAVTISLLIPYEPYPALPETDAGGDSNGEQSWYCRIFYDLPATS